MHHAYGLIRPAAGHRPRVAARAGDRVIELREVEGVPAAVAGADSLDPLLALGPTGWDDVHARVAAHLDRGAEGTPAGTVEAVVPVQPGDYVDFYASEHHATNLGRMFRPEGDALLPNWRHVPVGYHGRAGSVVVSGTPVRRPCGVLGPGRFGPSERLDLELELGFVVGTTIPPGTVVDPAEAERHVFGVALVNDWSARDIQAFEYQPLGPNNGKSFATSIAGWVTPLAALPRVPSPRQEPAPVEPLRATAEGGLDVSVGWAVNGTELGRANVADLYWTFGQMLAHLTTNGAGARRGDLFASGTISGPDDGQAGCLIEATWSGTRPVTLGDGSRRTWLEDGDTVTLTGSWDGDAAGRGELAEVAGTVLAATEVA